jgi:hypothetical protein
MENYFQFSYTIGYETLWNRTAVGKAAPAGHPAAKSGQKSVGSGTGLKRIGKFSVSLVPDIPRKGFTGATSPTHSRTPAQTIQVSEESVGEVAPEGTRGCRLSDRPMDLKAGSQSDRSRVWGSISPLPCLEALDEPGVELSETRAPCVAKGRRKNCSLEALPLATYKKKPKDLGPIWFSLMNLVFCLFPTSPVPGRPKGRPLSFIIPISRTEFLPLVLSRCPPKKGAWHFIFGFAHAILQVWMCVLSSRTCSDILGVQWFCCGTEEPFTGGKKSGDSSLVNNKDCMFISFLPMLQNLTLRNMFGIRLIVRSPTVHQRISWSLKECSEIRCDEYGDPKNFSGPVSMLPIYHGYDESETFHYLCKIQ